MRLTQKDGNKVWFAHGRPRGFLCPQDFCDNAYWCEKVKDRTCPYLQLLDKLAALEDAEEQGRLVILPVKAGDTVFSVFEGEDVFCGKVYAVSTCDGTNWFSVRYDSGLRYDHRWDTIGKTVFLTREEAEDALKGETEDV